jgi:phosphotransferase system enzyme I (PtsI)
MAGDPALTPLLLGLGLRCFSMLPNQLLKVKRQILNTDLSRIQPLIETILGHSDPEQTRLILQEIQPC